LWITVIAAGIWYISARIGSPATLAIVGIMLALAVYLLYEVITALKRGPKEVV
jgi:hypothetical protein